MQRWILSNFTWIRCPCKAKAIPAVPIGPWSKLRTSKGTNLHQNFCWGRWMRSILLGEFQRMFSFRIDDMPWRRLSWIDDMPCKSGVSVDVMPCASGLCREASLLHCFFLFFLFWFSSVFFIFFHFDNIVQREGIQPQTVLTQQSKLLIDSLELSKGTHPLKFSVLCNSCQNRNIHFWRLQWSRVQMLNNSMTSQTLTWRICTRNQNFLAWMSRIEASATRLNWVIILKTFWTRYMYNPVDFLIQYSALDSEAPASSGLLSSSFFFKSKACRRDIPELLADSIKAQIVSGSTSTRTGPSLFDFRRTAGKFRAIVNLKSVCTFNGM